jgi:putative salt-induced outer membrane protein
MRYRLGILVFGLSSAALAEEPPEGLMSQEAATTGTTDVEAVGFQPAEFTPAEEESTDATELAVSAGALLTAGNSKTAAGTAATRFRVRRDANQFKASGAINYAQSSTDADLPMETTVDNSQTNVRYDRFISQHFTLFLSTSTRRDRFQKIDFRLNLDPGVGYYLLATAKRQLWMELGYDYQYEVRAQSAVREGEATGEDIERAEDSHNGRLFLGYEDNVNEQVALSTGLEFLQSLTEQDAYRFAWNVALTSNLVGGLSTALTFSLLYNNAPLPGVEKTDASTAVNLVYNLL